MKNISTQLIIVFFFFSFLSINIYAQQCNVIYVSPSGAASGSAGTRTNPANLNYALTLVTATDNQLWLAQGLYTINTEIQLVSNVTIEGGFDPVTWIKSNATPSATIIRRSSANLLPAPANATAIFIGLLQSNFRLQDLTLEMNDPAGISSSAYGVYLNGCTNYNIVRCNITSGNASPGVNGAPGNAGAAGSAGAPGPNGNPNENVQAGGAGGVGGNNGGNGAANGRHSGNVNQPGQAGAGGAGCGGNGGASGTGPQCSAGCFFGSPNCNSATPGQPGQAGGPGANGANGTPGVVGVVSAPGYYIPSAAAGSGANGAPGCGGGGGGGGGGRQNSGTDDVGGAGGGGGGGGFGGTGGAGGTGGGGSFAVFLYSNGVGGNIVDCNLVAGSGGAGGVGGAGGAGGAGGSGGAGGGPGCGNTPGGTGGAGGAGGAGGNGGNGAAGLSQALSQNGGVAVAQSNITSVPGNPPVISVESFGCTNAEVVFEATTSGNWNFGAGANPATASGGGPFSVFYNSIGRKTITFAGTTFTDFVNIFSNQSASNTITHTNNPAVSGCPDTFSTTLVGSLYEWNFGLGSIPSTVVGSTFQSAVTAFTAPGTYTVEVWVTTACCGRVRDTLVVTIQPNTLSVSLSPSADSICSGGSLVYTSTPSGYLLYNFLVNNNPVQSSASNIFTTTALASGDSVTVLGFDGVCFTNPSATHYPVVTPIPSVTISDNDVNDTICGGDQITFTASPSGYDSYQFINGSSTQQTSAADSWTTTTLGQGNSVTVVAYQNGCASPPSNSISIYVNPIPIMFVNLSANPVCAGDTVIATATPSGLSSYDFLVNGSSIQNSVSDIFSSSTLANGDVISLIGSNNGCLSQPSTSVTLTINPIPVVSLSSSDADNSICQGETVIFTAAPSGYDSYEFLLQAQSVQNGNSSTYSTNQLSNGDSVRVIATDLGCSSPVSAAIITTVQPAPVVDAGSNQSTCINSASSTLSGFSPTGGQWSGNGISNPSGTFDPGIASVGLQSLVYTYTDAITGCSGLDSIVFTVFDTPTIIISTAADICEGQSTQLSATGGSTYTWSPAASLNNSTISNPIANPTSSTAYSVTVSDVNNCSSLAATQINVNPNPVAAFSSNTVCEGELTTFTNLSTPSGGLSFLWNFGDGNNSAGPDPSHSYSVQGNYSVTLIASLGNCFDTVTANTVVNPAAIASFTANPLEAYVDANSPIVFTDLSQNTDSYFWDFGDQNNSTLSSPSHVYTTPGIYTVTLIASNQFGCTDTLLRLNYIRILQVPKIFVPNAFTPNGDGSNDILYVYTAGIKVFDFQVYNRWGELVFESTNFLYGWDGVYKGKPADAGVYVYTLSIVFDDNSTRNLTGSIALIK